MPLWLHRIGLGWMMRATPLIVLTTRGRKTGLSRHTVVEFRRHGTKYYIVSGWGNRPNWYQNLLADPIVTVQRGGQTFRARAEKVDSPDEALRALYMFRKNSPFYEMVFTRMSDADRIDFQTLTEVAGQFTVVRLDPQEEAPALPGVEATDKHWLLLGLGIMLLFAVMPWLRHGKAMS